MPDVADVTERLPDVHWLLGRRPESIRKVNLRVLSPFKRALLAIDGTVTTFIEAYTQESLVVRRLSQDSIQLEAHHPDLDLESGSEVLVRRVVIEGERTGIAYVYADSVLAIGRLPETVRHVLQTQGASLGRALNAEHLEMWREVLWYGRERLGDGGNDARDRIEFLLRTYRIITGGKSVALVSERFPSDIDDVFSSY